MRFLGKAFQSFAKIGEYLCILFMVYVLLTTASDAFYRLTGKIANVEAEVIEIVGQESTKENPLMKFGPYQYNIKYPVKDRYIVTREPIISELLMEVGDKYTITINEKSGDIYSNSEKMLETIGYCLALIILTLFIKNIFTLLRTSIDVFFEEGKSGVFYGIKKFVFGSIGQVCLFMGVLLLILSFIRIPKFFNGDYAWVPSHIISVEPLYVNENNQQVVLYLIKQEQKGRWFQFEDKLVPPIHREPGDPIRYYMDTSTGKFAEYEFDTFYEKYILKGLAFVIAGIVLHFLSKSRKEQVIKDKHMVIDKKGNKSVINQILSYENEEKDMKSE